MSQLGNLQLGNAQLGSATSGGGVPADAVIPGHIASTASVYNPTVTLGSGVVYPESIASTAALYPPSMATIQIVSPPLISVNPSLYNPAITFAASAQTIYPSSFGPSAAIYDPAIAGGRQYILPQYIEPNTSMWFPTLTRVGDTYDGLKVFIAGRRRRLRTTGISIQMQLNGRSTASFTIYSPPGAAIIRPKPFQTVKITEYGRTEFIGLIETVHQVVLNPGVEIADYGIEWRITAVDWAYILDHRMVSGEITAGPAKPIVRNLITTWASGDSITTENVTTTASLVQTFEAQQEPLSQVLNRIAEQTGDVWFIDPNRDLHFHAPNAGPAAPIVVGSLSANVRDVVVTDSGVNFSNQVNLRTFDNIGVDEEEE